MSKKSTINSTHQRLKSVAKKAKKSFDPQELALYDRMVAIYENDLRAYVDDIASQDKATRKTSIETLVEFRKELKKSVFGKKGYSAPPWQQMKHAVASFDVLVGWCKNIHKYKAGDLEPAASPDQILVFREYMRTVRGKEYLLPSAFVDYLLICNGSSAKIHDGNRLMSLSEIQEQHEDFVSRGLAKAIPFGDPSTGNYYALHDGDVCDINHEDDSIMPIYPSLGRYFYKAHKITRR